MSKQDLEQRKSDVIDELDTYITNCINSADKSKNKKASLLLYWLKDYVKYLEREEIFKSTKLKKYKRGDIIKVNLGFNVGSEEGGLHYAVVLDYSNSINSSVITIIPLTSGTENDVSGNYDVYLGNDLYTNLKQKLSNEIDILESKTLQCLELEEVSLTVTDELFKRLEFCKKMLKESIKMKSGSIALVGQITTVSKLRIYDPKNTKGVLHGIRLSPSNLNEINKKLKKLYIFE